MPSHEEHCQQSLRKYGKTFSELHRWMDAPVTIMGSKHRMYRHDPYTTPKVARALFGEYADQACLDHIIADRRATRAKGLKVTRPVRRSELPPIAQSMILLFLAFVCFILGVQLIDPISVKYGGWFFALVLWFFAFLLSLGAVGSMIGEKPRSTREVYRYEFELKPPQMKILEPKPNHEEQNEEAK